MLNRQQRSCLDFISQYIAKHEGVAPSMAEIATGLNLVSKGRACSVVKSLVESGHLRHLPTRARALEVVDRRKFFVVDEQKKSGSPFVLLAQISKP